MNVKIMLLLSTTLVTIGFSQIQEFGGKGSIDWGNRTITATGIGAPSPNAPVAAARPMAIRAARNDALRNALELIKGLQLTSTTTVENFMVSSDVVRTSVQGYIQSFKEGEPKYMADKTIEITVIVPMDNKLAEAVLPPSIGNSPKHLPVATGGSGANFTGLIIDARGLGAIPALAPKILDENGKEIYGSAYVTRDFAVKWGMAGYSKTPEQAGSQTDRIGKQPGIIKAVKATGASKCDLVISNEDAQSVLAASKSMKFLADCRVIIIVD
jgi:hypothetical protein